MARTGWLTSSAAEVPPGDAWLSPRERAVLAGLRLAKRRDDWRLGRWTAKAAVAVRLDVGPQRVEVLAAADGAPDAWLNKGFLRLRQGKGRDALPLLEEGIKRQPRRAAIAYFARGLAHEDMGDFSAAYSDLRRAQALEPQWALPTRYLARYQRRNR